MVYVVSIEMMVLVEALVVVIVVFVNNEGMFGVTDETRIMNENYALSFSVRVKLLDVDVFVLDFLGVKRFGTVTLVTDNICMFLGQTFAVLSKSVSIEINEVDLTALCWCFNIIHCQ